MIFLICLFFFVLSMSSALDFTTPQYAAEIFFLLAKISKAEPIANYFPLIILLSWRAEQSLSLFSSLLKFNKDKLLITFVRGIIFLGEELTDCKKRLFVVSLHSFIKSLLPYGGEKVGNRFCTGKIWILRPNSDSL